MFTFKQICFNSFLPILFISRIFNCSLSYPESLLFSFKYYTNRKSNYDFFECLICLLFEIFIWNESCNLFGVVEWMPLYVSALGNLHERLNSKYRIQGIDTSLCDSRNINLCKKMGLSKTTAITVIQ